MAGGGGLALRVCAVQVPGFVGLFGEGLEGRRYSEAWQFEGLAGADMEFLRGLQQSRSFNLEMQIYANRTAALQGLDGGKGGWGCDIALGGLTSTPSKCGSGSTPCVEYSQPYFSSGVALLHNRGWQNSKPLNLNLLSVFTWGPGLNSLAAILVAAIASSFCVYGAERWGGGGRSRQRSALSGLSKSAAWAFSSISGVGFGNLPSSPLARLLGMLVSLMSVCIGAILAGVCASDYVLQGLQSETADPNWRRTSHIPLEPGQRTWKHFQAALLNLDLHNAKVCTAAVEPYPEIQPLLLPSKLVSGESFEECVKKLLQGQVAAVLDDTLVVRHYLQRSGEEQLGFFESDSTYNIAIAFERGSAIRHEINDHILKELARGSFKRTAETYFSLPTLRPNYAGAALKDDLTEDGTPFFQRFEGHLFFVTVSFLGAFVLLWAALSFMKFWGRSKDKGDETPREGREEGDVEDSLKGIMSPGVLSSPGLVNDKLTENILKALSALMRSNAQLNEKIDGLGSTASSASTSLQKQKEVTDRVVTIVEKLSAQVQRESRGLAAAIASGEGTKPDSQAHMPKAGPGERHVPRLQPKSDPPRHQKPLKIPKLAGVGGKEGALPPLRAKTMSGSGASKRHDAPKEDQGFTSYTRDDPDVIRAKYGMSSRVSAPETPEDIRKAMMELDDVNLVLSDASSDLSDDSP